MQIFTIIISIKTKTVKNNGVTIVCWSVERCELATSSIQNKLLSRIIMNMLPEKGGGLSRLLETDNADNTPVFCERLFQSLNPLLALQSSN